MSINATPIGTCFICNQPILAGSASYSTTRNAAGGRTMYHYACAKNWTVREPRPCAGCGEVRDVKVHKYNYAPEWYKRLCSICDTQRRGEAHAAAAERYLAKAAEMRARREKRKQGKATKLLKAPPPGGGQEMPKPKE